MSSESAGDFREFSSSSVDDDVLLYSLTLTPAERLARHNRLLEIVFAAWEQNGIKSLMDDEERRALADSTESRNFEAT